jgi:AcrR family transcriptional regulator
MASSDPREKLLQAAVAYASDNGLTDLSLRALAAELGTSHRMLIHHFGSKEGLWTAIVREVERRQIEAYEDLETDPGMDAGESLWAAWSYFSDPGFWPNERLFFEVYGQALRRRPHTEGLLEDVVGLWVEPAVEREIARGVDPEAAPAVARLGIAVTRGLLLDLLATGDRERVDEAMRAWISLYVKSLDN